ncbi:hypothetical protein HU200_061212 [Digitaria exilis]|uniref:DUF630 domain-containing protein n=1 Tax=Digitaria exilis TaxID=1010633 RepID=A0A835A8W5_9POAL|nr:hypothetical protein HU200_061212 [Digitaria exilis]
MGCWIAGSLYANGALFSPTSIANGALCRITNDRTQRRMEEIEAASLASNPSTLDWYAWPLVQGKLFGFTNGGPVPFCHHVHKAMPNTIGWLVASTSTKTPLSAIFAILVLRSSRPLRLHIAAFPKDWGVGASWGLDHSGMAGTEIVKNSGKNGRSKQKSMMHAQLSTAHDVSHRTLADPPRTWRCGAIKTSVNALRLLGCMQMPHSRNRKPFARRSLPKASGQKSKGEAALASCCLPASSSPFLASPPHNLASTRPSDHPSQTPCFVSLVTPGARACLPATTSPEKRRRRGECKQTTVDQTEDSLASPVIIPSSPPGLGSVVPFPHADDDRPSESEVSTRRAFPTDRGTMGCKGSKLDEQEAVALCRGRADLLAAAVRRRYALADAHDALADSLASSAAALHHLLVAAAAAAQPTRIGLPAARKDVGAGAPPARCLAAPLLTGSVSSSPPCRAAAAGSLDHHLPPHHPLPYPHYGYAGYGYGPEPAYGGYPPPGLLRLYYARSRPPPASVAVEQREPPSERVYYGSYEPTAAGYHSYGGEPAPALGRAPPPPSPPRSSSWDFFNVFGDYDVYDNYCYDAGGAGAAAAAASYTPSRSSREVREEEGIPELEEDDAVVKQVAGEFSAPGSGARSRRSSLGGVSSSIAEVDEEQDSVVDKEVIGGGNVARQQMPAQRKRCSVCADTPEGPQFVRAADAVRALSPVLEVGRRRYHHRSSTLEVSSSWMLEVRRCWEEGACL